MVLRFSRTRLFALKRCRSWSTALHRNAVVANAFVFSFDQREEQSNEDHDHDAGYGNRRIGLPRYGRWWGWRRRRRGRWCRRR